MNAKQREEKWGGEMLKGKQAIHPPKIGTSKHYTLLGLVIAIFLYLAIKIISSPDMIRYVPDDGFYYLQLAKHFAASGQWTFDGIHVTNGFHLFWAYLLAGISFVFNPSIEAFPIIAISTSLLIVCATIIYIGKDQSAAAILWIGFLITNQFFILNAISLTEFPLVILCAYCVITNKHPFVFSMLGVLARTDFILVPILCALITIADKESIKGNYKTILGGLIGIGLVSLHSYLTTGDIVQTSALIKNDWLSSGNVVSGRVLSLSTDFFGTDFFSSQGYIIKQIIFIALALIGIAAMLYRRKKKLDNKELLISITIIISYTVMYWTYAGVQSWYAADLFIPLLLIGGHAIETITRKRS